MAASTELGGGLPSVLIVLAFQQTPTHAEQAAYHHPDAPVSREHISVVKKAEDPSDQDERAKYEHGGLVITNSVNFRGVESSSEFP